MRIGIDFRAMQIGHQYRGIGEVLRNACRELDRRAPATDEFVAFVDPTGLSVAPILEDVFGSDRAVVIVALPHARRRAKWRRVLDSLSPRQSELIRSSCDVLLQFDFQLGVPEGVASVVVVHDQIPIILGDRYPHIYWPHYRVARRSGQPVRTAAVRASRRWLYEQNLARVLGRATWVLADSQHTAQTTTAFARSHGVDDLASRLTVALLGHSAVSGPTEPLNVMEQDRIAGLGLAEVPFVFFLGGADDRRRIDLLVAAFNGLRARGTNFKLVLAGDTFSSVAAVGSEAGRRAIASSSYRHDIHLMGFVTRAERAWLYRTAAAFVFPSEFEGFGLPVLESLALGCPVVAFDNSSLPEVAGPNAELVGESWRELAAGIERLIARDPKQKQIDAVAGQAWAAGFTWETLGLVLADRLDRLR